MPKSKKIAYLTIDDAPGLHFTSKVDYLLQHNIPAIFFCIGNLMEQRKTALVDAIHKGYIVANHSYTHPHFSKISIEAAKEEISKTDQLIDEIYELANVERRYKWFRFPYGDKGDKLNGYVLPSPKFYGDWFRKPDLKRKKAIQDHLKHLGYTQPNFHNIQYAFMRDHQLFDDIDWHWTFDIMEWAILENRPTFGVKDLASVLERMTRKSPLDTRGKTGSEKIWLESEQAEIVLLHDQDKTTDLFFKIVDELLELPVEFKDISKST